MENNTVPRTIIALGGGNDKILGTFIYLLIFEHKQTKNYIYKNNPVLYVGCLIFPISFAQLGLGTVRVNMGMYRVESDVACRR